MFPNINLYKKRFLLITHSSFFNGALASTNRGGKAGMKVNFLDDGGAAPLLLNKAANGVTSKQ